MFKAVADVNEAAVTAAAVDSAASASAGPVIR